MTLGMVSIFGGFVNAHAWSRNAGEGTRAILLASGLIEELKARPEKVTSTSGSTPGQLGLELEVPEDLEAVVTIRSFDELLKVFLVEVSCSWTIVDGVDTESLTAIITGEAKNY